MQRKNYVRAIAIGSFVWLVVGVLFVMVVVTHCDSARLRQFLHEYNMPELPLAVLPADACLPKAH